ncbi:thiol:disulfide interchange protein DsbA/DsbL [Xylella fastidiosa]|uniref:Thiol:disulfide interchange protein DsbA n=1 Tax=Xylella fastidiosa TaxID=2371 RepID=A0ABC8ACC2_XYLFS|nr:thiol:disulfide interchange protein DsbA/DsbL [Xylella fastidiosa]ALR06156.1 thiol:disulfide interchange protein DsbA/DsbL [Xylella fastidiosa]
MKNRFAMMLMALLPVLVACQAKDGSADTVQSAIPAPSVPPSPSTATTTPTTPPPEAARPVEASRVPSGPKPVAGTDYVVIQDGQQFQPVVGKIEVVEVFGYVCPACFQFQPQIGPWKAGLASDVHFVYVPAVFGGPWDDYARAFYAAETLNLQEKTHQQLYKAIHVDKTLKGERGRDTVQDIANFYAKFGVNPEQFVNTMSSFGISAKVNRAKQFAKHSQVTGTPSLIINGKYLVKGRTYDDMLRIADHLIEGERKALGK